MTPDQRKIQRLKAALIRLGPLLPGSLNLQWNVCGTPGCRCKHPTHPKRHGPYGQLSFNLNGRSSSLFVKKKDWPEVRRRLRRFQEFKKLSQALIQASVEQVRHEGLTPPSS